MESILSYMARYDYENLYFCQEKETGLRAIIALHDTTLGPATGGCRMWTYAREREAVEDALRLARGMTYKYAAAGVNLGGGKCVVLGNPATDKSEALLRTLGCFIDRLAGATKHGLNGLTKVLAVEWARHGIRVHSINPAYIATPMDTGDQVSGDYRHADIERRTPLGRYGTAEEVANTALFLASSASSFMTGSRVDVDGGWLAYGGW
jgi:NAD(P)-dependent dehydrogenase (short-subunit alcohol dehydrogenase family)